MGLLGRGPGSLSPATHEQAGVESGLKGEEHQASHSLEMVAGKATELVSANAGGGICLTPVLLPAPRTLRTRHEYLSWTEDNASVAPASSQLTALIISAGHPQVT